MYSTSSYCRSADALGEPGCDRGTGDGGSAGDSVARNTISDSSTSLSGTGSRCLLFRAASRCVFLLLLFVYDCIVIPREREKIRNLPAKKITQISPSPLHLLFLLLWASTPGYYNPGHGTNCGGKHIKKIQESKLYSHFIHHPGLHIHLPVCIQSRPAIMSLGSHTLVNSA